MINISKITAVLLAVMMLCSLTACSQSEIDAYSQIPSDVSVPSAGSSLPPVSSEAISSEPVSSEVLSSESSSSEEESSPEEESSSEESSLPGMSGSVNIEGAVPESAAADPSYFDDAVFVGDSVSLKLEYYNTAMGRLGGAQFLTAGSLGSANAMWEISNESVHPFYNGGQMKLEDSVPLTGAKKMYIMLGMNDIGLYGVEDSVANMKALIGRIEANAPGLVVYIQSMTPVTSTSTITSEGGLNNTNVRRYNELLLEACKENGWYFVDVASVMYDSDGYLRREYCSDPDDMGVHFTEVGCEAWIDYLYTHTAG